MSTMKIHGGLVFLYNRGRFSVGSDVPRRVGIPSSISSRWGDFRNDSASMFLPSDNEMLCNHKLYLERGFFLFFFVSFVVFCF
jgi:hypothetical protein